MATAPKASPAAPPPLPAPPPVPVSGITPARKAIAPTLTEEPKGQSPEKAFAERQRAAIAKATGQSQKAEDAAAGEDAAPPPKAPATKSTSKTSAENSTSAPSASSKSPTSKPSADSSTSPADTSKNSTPATALEKPADTATPAPAAEPVYDVRSLKKWAEQHPEEAAEIREKVFGLPADTREEWIRLKNRSRKLKAEVSSAGEKSVAEARAERVAAEQAKAAIDGAATKLAPIADLWEAVAEKMAADPDNPQIDFEAADAAFQENAKISIDDYMRLRARRAIGSGPDAVKLRAENARLKRELAGKPSDAIKPKAADSPAEKEDAGTAEPAAMAKPKDEKDWTTELGEKHNLRGIENWNSLLDKEMRKYLDSDTGDYDADPEEVADRILKREIERMMADDPDDAPATKPRPKPNGAAKPNGQAKPKARDAVPPASELRPKAKVAAVDDEEGDAPKGFAQRQAWAIQRAMKRARGEIE